MIGPILLALVARPVPLEPVPPVKPALVAPKKPAKKLNFEKPKKKRAAAKPLKTAKEPATGATYPIMMGLLLAAGAGALILKKRKGGKQVGSTIDIVASRVVAPKVRVAILKAHGREFLVSIGDKGVHLLSEWIDDPDGEAVPTEAFLPPEPAVTFEAPVEALRADAPTQVAAITPKAPPKPEPKREEPNILQPTLHDMSPAIAGLLALRNENRA